MIISKAIELLQFNLASAPSFGSQDIVDATKLGLEALKRIQEGRLHPFSPMYSPLPGESMPERGIR